MDKTEGTGNMGEKSAEIGSRDRTGGTDQLDSWAKTTVTGQPGQERYNRMVRKTGQDNQCKDSKERTTRAGQGKLGQDNNTRQTLQDSHGKTVRTGHIGQDSQDRSVWRGRPDR
jgi:hypothetical protein